MTTTLTRRDARADLDHALSTDLLASLVAARKRRDQADAQIRLLLAYGLEFQTPARRPSVTLLARLAGKSRNTVRAGRAYTPADIARLAALLGRTPRREVRP
jgi:hypothetical protein